MNYKLIVVYINFILNYLVVNVVVVIGSVMVVRGTMTSS